MKFEIMIPLVVNLTGNIRHHYDEKSVLPAHEFVIRPLLEKSMEAFVYKGSKDEFFLCGKMQIPIALEQEDILIAEKGKFRFDNTKECILGHEYLWNATTWKRGSVVIIIENGKVDFSTIFKHTYRPSFTDNPNTGNNIAATKKCRMEAEKGNIAICLPASNGIEYMNVYAKADILDKIVDCARTNCQEKNFYGEF